MTKFEIHQFICRTDNYGVLVSDADTGLTMSVDAPDAKRIDEELEKKKLNLTHLLITHKHQDHIDGIEYLKNKYNCIVLGPESEKDQIPHLDITLIGDEYIDFSGSPIRVIETPGHTLGHIVFFFEREKILFAGDTLFLMGCGRVFEGTHEQMFESIKKIRYLPIDTVIYCGHEYSLANAKFAISIYPDNENIGKRYEHIQKAVSEKKYCLPTTLERELRTNPFLMYDDPVLKNKLGKIKSTDLEVFSETRTQKDNF